MQWDPWSLLFRSQHLKLLRQNTHPSFRSALRLRSMVVSMRCSLNQQGSGKAQGSSSASLSQYSFFVILEPRHFNPSHFQVRQLQQSLLETAFSLTKHYQPRSGVSPGTI